ncbi:MAG TPA: hypothetical protein VHY35_24770 [Stellaceae bacterium]|nr:hypothetical protein [Stellaceae bacterium]
MLSLLAASLAAGTRSEARIAHNRVEAAVARGMADAGFTFAIEGLLDTDLTKRWPADGRTQTIAYAGGRIVAAINDEAGKLDLNTAPIEMIAGLLRSLAIDPAEARSLLDGIVARRQQFPLPKIGARSLAADPGEPPLFDAARRPFASVAELRLAAPLSQLSYERLRPFVTVYTRSTRVNPLTASLPVLLAIPGIRPAEAAAFIEARGKLVAGGPAQELPTIAGVDDFIESGDLRHATVTSVATTRAGVVYAREAVIALAQERPLTPFTILQWTQAATAAPDAPPAAPD